MTSDPLSAGDVVVVPFPYADRSAEKRRPAVVVSGAAVAAAGFVWVVMVTSARNPPMPEDVVIGDLDAAGLRVASVVRPLKIACIEPARILRRIGTLTNENAALLLDHARSLIGTRVPPHAPVRTKGEH